MPIIHQTPKTVAIILARGGSKGVPRKNIRPLLGKPLIAYAIEPGLAAKKVDRVIVSTDDAEIAEVAISCGAEVPFTRPSELAKDSTPDLPVYQHLINWLEENEGYKFDFLLNLRCTTPFKTPAMIDDAVALLAEGGCDSVRTAHQVAGEEHPYWMFKKRPDGLAEPFVDGIKLENYHQRQLLPPCHALNFLVDAMRVDVVMNSDYPCGKKVRLLEVDPARAVDIDTERDFVICEALLKAGVVGGR